METFLGAIVVYVIGVAVLRLFVKTMKVGCIMLVGMVALLLAALCVHAPSCIPSTHPTSGYQAPPWRKAVELRLPLAHQPIYVTA